MAVLIRFSFVDTNFYNKFVEIIYKLTDPVLLPVQKLISRLMGGRPIVIDLSLLLYFF